MKDDSLTPERQEPGPEQLSSQRRYRKTSTGLWFLTQPDNPNDPGEWVSDPIRPLARVYIEDPLLQPRGEWAVEIEHSQGDGTRQRRLIRCGDLHASGRRVIAGLARAGMQIAADRKGQDRLLNYLARVRPPTLLRLGELTVQGVECVLCLRPLGLAFCGGAYEPRSWHFYELYDEGRKFPQVVRILDTEDDVI